MADKSFYRRVSKSPTFMGIVVVVVGAWATHWLGPRPTPIQTPRNTTESTNDSSSASTLGAALASSPISLSRWQFHVESNQAIDAQQEHVFKDYLGQQVTWEGYFQGRNRNQYDPTPGNCYVVTMVSSRAALTANQPLGPPFVRCWFPAEAGPELESLHAGQWIVIRGTLADPGLLGSKLCTDVRVCKLLGAGEDRNIEVAARVSSEREVRR